MLFDDSGCFLASPQTVDITPDLVRKTADLAQIKVTDEEVEVLVPRMEEFLGFVEKMEEIPELNDGPVPLKLLKKKWPGCAERNASTVVARSNMSQEREGIGPHAMWGYTPAQDLLREAPVKGEANILICQPGDIGHVLRTIGTRRRHPQHMINLYVWESQIEVLARHLLLLKVAQDWELPIRQRANTFLEIFGNCSVQDRTARYIARLGRELIDMLFSTESMDDIVDLSLLKCRERDQLEEVFRSWSCEVPCNMTTLRDARLRRFFGERYDYRKNLVDWDYTNRLKDVASIVHHTQYRNWRLGGVAYEFGDQVYDQPNRTMVSYAEGVMLKGQHRGMKKEMRGFWLDIRVGPFITFGVDCECPNAFAQELFAVVNKGTGTEQHRHNTAEVAVHSIISYLWGMETRGYYAMTKDGRSSP
eukprot:g17627.t2